MDEQVYIKLNISDAKALLAHYEHSAAALSIKAQEIQVQLDESIRLLNSIRQQLQPDVAAAGHKLPVDAPFIPKYVPTGLFAQMRSSNHSDRGEGYDVHWNYTRKAFYILRLQNKLMSLNQILDEMKMYDPKVAAASDGDYRKIQANVSINLKINVTNTKKLNRVKSQGGEYLYGFSEWFTPDGVPKTSFS